MLLIECVGPVSGEGPRRWCWRWAVTVMGGAAMGPEDGPRGGEPLGPVDRGVPGGEGTPCVRQLHRYAGELADGVPGAVLRGDGERLPGVVASSRAHRAWSSGVYTASSVGGSASTAWDRARADHGSGPAASRPIFAAASWTMSYGR
ncbi:hypothetical protein EASAB2608_01057 [Streptomyces sp. EAS-AB2608]|nr:hypothetical protein EASAB2608_01057 [Streptomyces sp. EAS-AB2608]